MKDQKRIEELKDEDLLESVWKLRCTEHEALISLLLHLGEVEQRKLYRDAGCSSMFSYLVEKLHYGEGAAAMRLRASRVVCRYPEALRMLKRHGAGLSSLARISSILTEENSSDVFEQICGKSKREVELYVASFRPVSRPRAEIKPIRVKGRTSRTRAPLFEAQAEQPSLGKATDSPVGPMPQDEVEYLFRFTGSPKFQEKFEEVKNLIGIRNATGNPAEVFEVLLEFFLEKRSPVRRQKRRKAKTDRSNDQKITDPGISNREQQSQKLSEATRDAVLERDAHRCTFSAPDGRRCTARQQLQIDHIEPQALGGSSEEGNLRVLCAAHNRLEAERLLGREYMEQFYSRAPE